jgi:hypothetical protein
MERQRNRSDMPKRVGVFIDPFNGKLLSATFESGRVSMRYINDEPDKTRVVAVADFNDWFLKNLIPVPMKMHDHVQK